MKTVKVTVKRGQIEKALGEKFPIRRISTRGVGLFSSITQAEYSCPNEITLELPAEQVELPEDEMTTAFEGPIETLRCHDFEEIYLEGLGKIKRCRICGTAREVRQEVKRKRFKVAHVVCHLDPQSGKPLPWLDGDISKLEEVE